MATLNLKAHSNGSRGTFSLLETDVYRMKIARASIEADQFAEARKDGTQPEKLVLCWEVTEASPEQDDSVVGLSVWQRINPYYGTVREGGVSKFKAFLDSLEDQGLLTIDLENFDTDSLIGVEQRISVEKYIKTMGANAGQPGNRVATILPLRRRKAPAKAAPTKNVAVAVDDTDGEDLF